MQLMRGVRKDGGTYICMIDNIMSVDNNLKNLKKKCEKRPLIGYTIYIHRIRMPNFLSQRFSDFFFENMGKRFGGMNERESMCTRHSHGWTDDPFINQESRI
jgi:hypothetical protein